MTATLATFRADCARFHRHRSGRCWPARRKVLHALLSRHSPEAVVRRWLVVAKVLDAVEQAAREGAGA